MRRQQHAGLAVILAASAIPAHAANLITNPDFTTDLSGWTVFTSSGGTVTFDSTSGSPTTGAIRLTASNGGVAQAKQCITLGPQSIDLIVRRYIVTSVGPITEADTNWIAYSGANCLGNLVGAFATNAVTGFPGFFNGAAASWDELYSLSQSLPAGTVSVQVSIYISAGASATLDFLFDDIRFGPSGTVPVRLQSFDVK